MAKFRTIGVLGGIGPVATVHFYHTLLKIAQQQYGAIQDQDYPHLIINSLAFEGSSEYGLDGNGDMVLEQLLDGSESLQRAGVDLIVVPCGSAHRYIEQLRAVSRVPIPSIIDELTIKVKLNKHNI